MLQLGFHLAVSGGFCDAIRKAESVDANTFSFFIRNPRSSHAKPLDSEDLAAATSMMKADGFGKLVAHGSYTMNLCTAVSSRRAFAASLLEDDLRRMSLLPGHYYNFHPGSHVGQGVDTAVAQICDALNSVLHSEFPVTVLLETMSGKGSEVGSCFEELKWILDGVSSKHVGICLDTCHVFDAGYDIVNDLAGVLLEFDREIGIDRIYALHLNDSKNPLGSHKDRHACIGDGYIGMDAFTRIITHPLLCDKPMILETPNDLMGYKREIHMLRQCADSI